MFLKSHSTEETMEFGASLAVHLMPGDIILLTGDLGAGKTTFTKGIAKGLSVEQTVTSPSFTIMNQYQGNLPLYHFDLYRIDDPDEFLELGLEEFLFGEGISVIEWSEKLPELPSEFLKAALTLDSKELDNRNLKLIPIGNRYKDLTTKFKNEIRGVH